MFAVEIFLILYTFSTTGVAFGVPKHPSDEKNAWAEGISWGLNSKKQKSKFSKKINSQSVPCVNLF
jgi:hypothetical protein